MLAVRVNGALLAGYTCFPRVWVSPLFLVLVHFEMFVQVALTNESFTTFFTLIAISVLPLVFSQVILGCKTLIALTAFELLLCHVKFSVFLHRLFRFKTFTTLVAHVIVFIPRGRCLSIVNA